jgi:hypothetical protein
VNTFTGSNKMSASMSEVLSTESQSKIPKLDSMVEFPSWRTNFMAGAKSRGFADCFNGYNEVYLDQITDKLRNQLSRSAHAVFQRLSYAERKLSLEKSNQESAVQQIRESQANEQLPDDQKLPEARLCTRPVADRMAALEAGVPEEFAELPGIAHLEQNVMFNILKVQGISEDRKREMIRQDSRAIGFLEEHLCPEFHETIRGARSAAEGMKLLEVLFKSNEQYNVTHLIGELVSKVEDLKRINLYVLQKKKLRQRLKDASVPISDKLFVGILLGCLPKSLRMTRRILESKRDLTVVNIESILLSEANDRLLDGEDVFPVRLTPAKRPREEIANIAETSMIKKECSHCLRKGHTHLDCYVNPRGSKYNLDRAKRHAMRFYKFEG